MRTRWILALVLVLAMLLPGASLAEPMTYNLSPSLDGDDTEEIQAVFDEAAANPGSTIAFAEGDYYLSDTVEVTDLSVRIRGAGSTRTVLHTTPDVLFGLTAIPDLMGPGQDVTMAVMFLLLYTQDGLQLEWEGMGWDIAGDPEPYLHGSWGVPMTGLYPIWIHSMGGNRELDTTWRDIRMTGRERPGFVTAVNLYAHWLYHVSGNHVFQDCHYDTMDYGPALWGASGANVTVGGARLQDRVTARNMWVGVFFAMASHSRLEVTNLRVWREDTPRTTAGPAVYIPNQDASEIRVRGMEAVMMGGIGGGTADWATEPSTILFEHNTVVVDPVLDWAGVEIWDSSPVEDNLVVRNNRISVESPRWAGPILLCNTDNAVVSGNTLSGRGPAALWLGVFGDWGCNDSRAVVKGNNVQGWTVDGGLDEPDWHGAAAIWMGPTTSGNSIIGNGNLGDLVLDETDDPLTPEYDGANFLSGVNSGGGEIGEAVREAMMLRKDVRDLFR